VSRLAFHVQCVATCKHESFKLHFQAVRRQITSCIHTVPVTRSNGRHASGSKASRAAARRVVVCRRLEWAVGPILKSSIASAGNIQIKLASRVYVLPAGAHKLSTRSLTVKRSGSVNTSLLLQKHRQTSAHVRTSAQTCRLLRGGCRGVSTISQLMSCKQQYAPLRTRPCLSIFCMIQSNFLHAKSATVTDEI
jgi:hypothetical protein